MNPLHSPLGLRARLQPPRRVPIAVPLVSVALIALLLSFASSRHIFAPGVAVSLEKDSAANVALALPRASTPLHGERTDATLTVPALPSSVLTARSDTMVFFEGKMHPLKDPALRAAMAEAVRNSGEKSPTLLLKMDGSVSLNRFFQLRAFAEEAGFTRIVIAGEDSRSATPQTPATTPPQASAP